MDGSTRTIPHSTMTEMKLGIYSTSCTFCLMWDLGCVRDENWNAMVRWIEEYKNQYGRLPLRASVKAPDGRSMGNWISLQRTALSKGKVAEDRKTRLADLGIYPFGSTKMPL